MERRALKQIVLEFAGPPQSSVTYEIGSEHDAALGRIIRQLARNDGLPTGRFALDEVTFAKVERVLRRKRGGAQARLVGAIGLPPDEEPKSGILIIPEAIKDKPDHIVNGPSRLVLKLLPAFVLPVLMFILLTVPDQGQDILRSIEGSIPDGCWLAIAVAILLSLMCALLPDFVSEPGDSPSNEQRSNLSGEPRFLIWLGGWVGGAVIGLIAAFVAAKILFYLLGMLAGALITMALTGSLLLLLSQPVMQRDGVRIGIGLTILITIALYPAELGNWLGTALILTLALSGWLLIAADISRLRRRWHIRGEALVVVGLVATIVFVLVWKPPFDDIGKPRDRKSPRLITLDTALQKSLAAQQTERPTIVIVAAAGGGVRASYWTAKVLARATDQVPTFQRQLFLASGVSGGSLGLALYRALLATPDANCVIDKRIEPCVNKFHEGDFLAGILASSITGEVFNLGWRLLPQRGRALEETWEERWRSVTGQSNRFAEPFMSLFASDGPSLVLNTTAITDGDRIPVSNLDTSGWLSRSARCRANVAAEVDLPLSAAANASARFPFLVEWGRFPVRHAPGCKQFEAIADGGFNDNYGAATALEALLAVQRSSALRTPARIIVIQLVSDPECPRRGFLGAEKLAAECEQAKAATTAILAPTPINLARYSQSEMNRNALLPIIKIARPRFRDETPGPLGVLMRARGLTGSAVAEALRQTVCESGGSYYLFSMSGAFNAPLGWAMSKTARADIDARLQSGVNAREMANLVGELNGTAQRDQPYNVNCADLADAQRPIIASTRMRPLSSSQR